MNGKKFLGMLLAVALCLSTVLSVLPTYTVRATEAGSVVVGFASPAICTDAGVAVDLSAVSVQFTMGGRLVPGSEITWQNGESTVTSYTPSVKGVYPLTATAGSESRTVYVVAKNANETEYVLYENDFSTAPNMSDFRVVEQCNDTPVSYDASAGTLVLDASGSDANYVRMLLPSYLDGFGDAVMSATMQVTEQYNNNRFGSFMFRVQNADSTGTPYVHSLARYRIGHPTSGIQIAERTKHDLWRILEECQVPGIKNGSVVNVTTAFCADTIQQYVNGTQYLEAEQVSAIRVGAMGVLANGCKLVVDNLKVTVNPETKVTRTLHDTRDTESSIALSPLLITQADTAAQLAALSETLPAVVIVDAAVENDVFGARIDGQFMAIDALESAIDARVIPAFRVTDSVQAEALGAYAASLALCDMYVISQNTALIAAARNLCDDLYGLLEVSGFDGDNEALRSATLAADARGVVFASELASRDTVSYLQDRYLTVWQTVTAEDVSAVSAINNGVLGLVTPDVTATETCFTDYYTENTLTRTPEIIGHRGVPSLAQENSIVGALKALEVGADMVECDIYLMADGQLVVMHDDTLDRTTDGTGNTVDQTADTIKNYQIDVLAGADPEPIPLLEDYFKALKSSGSVIVIELKADDTTVAAPLVELINEYEMHEQVVILSFHDTAINAVRSEDPTVSANMTSTSIYADEACSPDITQEVLSQVIPLNTAFSPSKSRGTLGENYYNDLLARAVTVWPFTVDTQAELDAFFVSGVRGITTNYSQRAGNYINRFEAVVNENGTVALSAVSYDGKAVSTDAAELVVIGGTGTYDAVTGQVTVSESAKGYFFRLTGTLTNGTSYSVVTPVLGADPADVMGTADRYLAHVHTALGVNKGNSAASATVSYDAAQLTPTFYAPWAHFKWDTDTVSAHTASKNVYMVVSEEIVLQQDGALLFYVKLPENAPETTIGFRFSDQTKDDSLGINNRSLYVTVTDGAPVYLMPKDEQKWTATTAVNDTAYTAANDVVFPAGFDGWVRIPYDSLDMDAQGWTTLDFFYVRLYPKAVDSAFIEDGLCVGGLMVADNGDMDAYAVQTEVNNTPVRLFKKTYTQPTADSVLVTDKTFATLTVENSVISGNPDRGFRSEEKYVLSDTEIARVAALTDAQLQAEIKKETQEQTRGETPTVSRIYFKMQAYAEAEAIPQEAIDYVNRILAAYKALGIRAYLEFYYTSDPTFEVRDTIPATDTILAHMDQYKTVLETSKDAIAALCFGLIGDDGEWDYVMFREDGTAYPQKLTDEEYNAVVTKMFTVMLPDDMHLVMDQPVFKQTYVEPLLEAGTITQDRFNRIGFDEAGMYGLDDSVGNKMWRPGSEQWKYGMAHAPYAYNDAETAVTKWFYTNDYTNPSGTKYHIDASALQSMSQQWTATFSAYHSNGDHGSSYSYEDTNFYYWKNHVDMKITAEKLTEWGLPFTPNWFKNERGETVIRSVYDYLRDYLGYRLSVENLTVTGGECAGQTVSVDALLRNYGYAAPLTMTESGFAILDKDGNVVSTVAAGDPKTWYATDPTDYENRALLDHTVGATLTLPETAGTYRLAIYLRNSNGQAVRFDNATPYENGYQILHTFNVAQKDYYAATKAKLDIPSNGTGSTSTLVTDALTGLTPNVPSRWVQWVWNDLDTHNDTPAAQHPLVLSGLTLTEGSALMLYVKLPAAAPATPIGFRLSDGTNYNLNVGQAVYLLSVKGDAWQTVETVANSRQSGLGYVPFPAGFEGWVRIPYASTALTAELTPTRIRLYLAAVDESFTTDSFCVGAVSVVDAATQEFYKIKASDETTAVPLFHTVTLPTGATMDRTFFRGDESYRNADGSLNDALKVTVSDIRAFKGCKLYYQYTDDNGQPVKVLLRRGGSPYYGTAVEPVAQPYTAAMATLATPSNGTQSTAELVSGDGVQLVPNVPSSYVTWLWTDDQVTAQMDTSSSSGRNAQNPLKVSDLTLGTGKALMMYVKLPDDAPQTPLAFRLSVGSVHHDLNKEVTAYLLSQSSDEWTAVTTTTVSGRFSDAGYVMLPAGFEGFVRLPYESFENTDADLAVTTLRLYVGNVTSAFTDENDMFSVGAVCVVDNGSENRHYISTADGSITKAVLGVEPPAAQPELDETNVTEFYIDALHGTHGEIVAEAATGNESDLVSVLGTSLVYYEAEDGTVSSTTLEEGTEYFRLRFVGRAVRELTVNEEAYKLKHIRLRVTTENGTHKEYQVSILTDRCTAYADFAKVLRGKDKEAVYSIRTIGVYEKIGEVGTEYEVYSDTVISKSYNEITKLETAV